MTADKHGVLEMRPMAYGNDRPKAKNPVKVQDVSLRDGHQSIFATRGRTEDMIPIAEMLDQVGFHSLEVWGGATFDTMHRFLGEDPWERLHTLKKYIKNTPFSMLLRGQNVVGYRNYADDVVETFVQRSCDNGVDIFRVFDALNDFRNFETAVKVIKENKKHFQGTICYSLTEKRMGGEIYNIDYYLKKAKELENIGADSVCIKDMAGLIAPYDAYNLIKALKKEISLPVHLHTHFTSGMGDLTVFKAIEAGVDIIDTCMAPYAYRTSHAAIEPLVISLLGTNRDTGFDINLLSKISNEMEKSAPKYAEYMNNTKLSIIDTNVIIHQTPGGMLSNLINQLRQMDALDKLEKVFEELPKVRKDLGSIPLVTPTSQIVGTQTVNNVLFDGEKRYSQITEQVKDLCYGLYGKTTRPVNNELMEKALASYPKGKKPVQCRPGDIIPPEMEEVKEKISDLAKNIDDELIYAIYPVTGKRFLEWKYGIKEMPEEVKAKTLEDIKKEKEIMEKIKNGKIQTKENIEIPENARIFDVFVDGEHFSVAVSEKGEPLAVNPVAKTPKAPAAPQPKPQLKAKPASVTPEGGNAVVAPIPGMVAEYKVKEGDPVKAGDTVVIIEAMKMFNNLNATRDGKVSSINFSEGDNVMKDDVLLVIE
ncbi:MAG: carboxylase [Candidatus Cloacimonadota bacterium]|nr:MAG: carboxylase [Candidatus Cloacimonadota bacterium]